MELENYKFSFLKKKDKIMKMNFVDTFVLERVLYKLKYHFDLVNVFGFNI